MNPLTFILGGARSGKSRFALELGNQHSGTKIFLATAQAFDAEMAERIAAHQQERGFDWQTIEAPLDLAETLKSLGGKNAFVVIDCLTLWLSNVLISLEEDEKKVRDRINRLIDVAAASDLKLVAVSNEVGHGIVPADALSRRFRDLAGFLNQRWAEISQEVYLMTAGIPQKIKRARNETT